MALRWLISILATLIISIVSSHVNASSVTTISFVLDNDILRPEAREQDYTGGFKISDTSGEANQSPFYFKDSLKQVDELFSVERSSEKNI